MERTFKDALAYHLTLYATSLLMEAARLRGDHPALHNNAEFQSLDIMAGEHAKQIEVYRTAMAPFGVAQLGDVACAKK